MKTGAARRGAIARRAALTAFALLASLVYGLSTPIMAALLIGGLQIYPALSPAEVEGLASGGPAAIVILSAGARLASPEFGGDTLDSLSLERVRYGARLARATGLPVLVTGGVLGNLEESLAALLAKGLEEDYGIIAKWRESRSINTHENALFSSAILKQAGITRIVLVTHAWHMKRAAAAFRGNGMSVIAAPTAFYLRRRSPNWTEFFPSPPALLMSGYALHEIVGGVWYRLRYGYVSTLAGPNTDR